MTKCDDSRTKGSQTHSVVKLTTVEVLKNEAPEPRPPASHVLITSYRVTGVLLRYRSCCSDYDRIHVWWCTSEGGPGIRQPPLWFWINMWLIEITINSYFTRFQTDDDKRRGLERRGVFNDPIPSLSSPRHCLIWFPLMLALLRHPSTSQHTVTHPLSARTHTHTHNLDKLRAAGRLHQTNQCDWCMK